MPAQAPPMTKKQYNDELKTIRDTYNATQSWPPDPVALGVYARSCTELNDRRDNGPGRMPERNT